MSAVAGGAAGATRRAGEPAGVRVLMVRAAILAALAGGWQLAAVMGATEGRRWSSPLQVLERFWSLFANGTIWPHLADTIGATVVAIVLSALLGTGLGLLLARRPLLEATLDPVLATLQGIPRIAFAPLIVLFLGVGFPAKVTLSVSIALFVFYANVQQGLRRVDPVVLRNLQLMGATEREQFRMAVFPSLVPWLWAALDLGLGLALIGVIISEFISSTRGLGHLIVAASLGFDTTGVVALLAVTMLVVMVLRAGIARARARWLPWS